jgi:hypothetical protein
MAGVADLYWLLKGYSASRSWTFLNILVPYVFIYRLNCDVLTFFLLLWWVDWNNSSGYKLLSGTRHVVCKPVPLSNSYCIHSATVPTSRNCSLWDRICYTSRTQHFCRKSLGHNLYGERFYMYLPEAISGTHAQATSRAFFEATYVRLFFDTDE